MPETIRQWVEDEPDPRQRAIGLGVALSDDFAELFDFGDDPRDPQAGLLTAWARLAKERVNWRRVAEALLRRFAGSVSRIRDTPPARRAAWPPEGWHGLLN